MGGKESLMTKNHWYALIAGVVTGVALAYFRGGMK